MTVRNYSLAGPDTAAAHAAGLVDADWYLPTIDPVRLRALQRRSNVRAAVDTALWVVLLLGSAWLAWWSLGTDGVIWWQAVPAFALYGALYGGAADARWHECGHGTAFASRRANDVVYAVASFMLWRGPTLWRWSHHRHHTDSIIVGRDAEIAFQRPPSLIRTAIALTNLRGGVDMLWRQIRHAAGRLDTDALDLVPASDHRRVIAEARVFVGIVGAVVVWCVLAGSIVPALFIGGPTIYGGWLFVFFGLTQHAGLREDVLDHRYNTRTVRMNPVFRFLYLNMNHHLEHHMFPSVPYHALPALHDEIAEQLPPASPSTWAAYREIITTMWRQRRDPSYEAPREVPDTPGRRAPVEQGRDDLRRRPDGTVDLGPVAAMSIGDRRRVDSASGPLLLVRHNDGVALVSAICTHADVALDDGAVNGCTIECPKHNACFDLRTGDVVRGPARQSLRTHRVDIVGGQIIGSLGTD